MFREITKDNWLLYAQQNYDNPTLQKEVEFYDDIKRLFRKYKVTGNLKLRLVLNHIIVLNNVFGVESACTLLLYKIDRPYWPALKSFLVYLEYLYPHELNDVKEDKKISEGLKEL